ncbi:sugar phosphate isomerase/epimerase [Citricoccus sp. SGAir0253]|uniref:sugar phosphate isomerase/epimerase family protein n=1 Tax=Citricoccus sp. SGAir0253 TaxID=2567881 RepID=UPI0010CCC60B|nr:sugar phosphate isomerase/epimerase family protein [Citricoccus sp. SGAir0253]QCU76990.1 sugar phosphate isomerase/epimerase [Citricoccus sp. SGAir0253]
MRATTTAPATASVAAPGRPALAVDLACQGAAFTTDPFGEDFARCLPVLRDAGYRRVVLGPLDPSSRGVADLARRIGDAGLAPIAMAVQSPEANVASPEPHVRRRGHDRLRRFVDLAGRLGADQLNGVPYGVHGDVSARPDERTLANTAQLVGDVADEAAAAGIMMTFEVVNRYETSVVNTAAEAVRFVELSGSRNLRIHLDTFHMAVEEADLVGAVAHALPYLGYLEFGQSSRGLLSTGSLDLPRVLAEVRALGYTGRYGVEGFSRPLMQEPVADALRIWATTFATGEEFVHDAAVLFAADPAPPGPRGG